MCSYNILVASIACGSTHTHILSKDGFLYSTGSNKEGKLGLGLAYSELPFSICPRLVESLTNVSSVACGSDHSLACDSQGRVYGWGSAEWGAIGMRLSSSCFPNIINFNK
mmetsp:Transcript_31050/g.30502  ORF Transcript_31050/g.30502 Transcript_31050/m.30502 type:complete len:110 (+) Transcript_31050:211-540(+)